MRPKRENEENEGGGVGGARVGPGGGKGDKGEWSSRGKGGGGRWAKMKEAWK